MFFSSTTETTRALIEYVADVNIVDINHKTILHIKADSRNHEYAVTHIREFLQSGISINVVIIDCFGHIPSDYATRCNNI